MISDHDYLYQPGSGLEVPGIEGVLEYGDASKLTNDGIPGALRINDRSMPDQVHVTELSGLQDDPEISDSRTERAGHWGERAGILMPRGRTVGLTGQVRAGNVARMRDLWRRLRDQFGRDERDLIIHPPGEVAQHINEIWSGSGSGWIASQDVSTGIVSAVTAFTDAALAGITATVLIPDLPSAASKLTMQPVVPIAWYGRDMWMSTLIASTGPPVSGLSMSADFVRYSGTTIVTVGTWTPAGAVTSPTTGTYYSFAARMVAAANLFPDATHVIPRITMSIPSTSTDGIYTMRAARVAIVMLDADQDTPAGFFGGTLPGFEFTDAAGASTSHGPSYVVNQAPDPSMSGTYWANDSTSGVTVDTAGGVVYDWPGDGRTSNLWTIHNPSTTSRTLAIRTPSTLTVAGGLFVVASGRMYRAHVRLRIDESYAAGLLSITWLAYNGAVLSTSPVDVFDAVAAGTDPMEFELDGIVTAPTSATHAYMRVATSTPSTTSGQRISMRVAEPRFYDVSDYDPGIIEIDSNVDPEIGVGIYKPVRTGPGVTLTPAGARRRIPRPFLLRKVRALWDGKAPESQRNLQYRRDFTMALRAADPRIYVVDERRSHLKLSGSATQVSQPPGAFRTFLDTPPTILASDSFTGTATGVALNGRTAPVGGTWATSGDTFDFQFTDSFAPTGDGVECIIRPFGASETVGRYAILGTTNYTNILISARCEIDRVLGDGRHIQAIVARFSDANNHVRLVMPDDVSVNAHAYIEKVVAGTPTTLATATVALPRTVDDPSLWRMSLTVYDTGQIIARVYTDSGASITQFSATDSSLATGGALASGKPGLWDKVIGTGASTFRGYDEFVASMVNPYSAPINFTSEGSLLDIDVVWKTSTLGGTYPLDGISLGPSETAPPASGYLSQASLSRMYYSAGSITYTTPQVTMSGDVVIGGSVGKDYSIFTDSLIGGAWQYNYIGALLKRVNSTTWIEARYNSANKEAMNAFSLSPAAPFSLELWCSHNTSGTLTTTRLGGWDVPTNIINNGARKRLRTYMDSSNVVYVELWTSDPNLDDEGLVSRQSFTLSSSLITLLGATVAGRAGLMARLGQWDDGTHTGISVGEMAINYESPYISTFDAVDFNSALFLIDCPVIGDADDVPLKLQLRGGIDTPTIVLASSKTGSAELISLSGVFSESDPVTIDMDAGTIKSASGADYFDRRLTGSRFFSLSPGQNVIGVQAVNWSNTAPAHVIATYRDSLR